MRPGQDGDAWEFLGLLSLYDPPREDTAATISSAQALGIEVKMVTGDHIAIAKETSRLLGLHTNILRTEVLLQRDGLGDQAFLAQYGEYVENADGFAEVMPEHKFSIVDVLQQRGFTVGMTGDGVNDAPALKQADIGIAVHGATDAARAAADIVLMTPGLSVIIDAIIHSRMIFQRMKNYCTYRIACTIQILIFFFFAIILLKFEIPVFVICLISILNDGTIMSIAYDAVIPSRSPTKWELPKTVAIASIIGLVGVCSTFVLLYLAGGADAEVAPLFWNMGLYPLAAPQIQALIYLQLSIGGQATIFVARTKSFFFSEMPGTLLFCAFWLAQLASTLICVYVTSGLSPMIGLGMNCAGPDYKDWEAARDHLAVVNECAALSKTNSSLHCADDYCTKSDGSGWTYALFVWGYCGVWIFLQDFAKLLAMRFFDLRDPMAAQKEAKREQTLANKQALVRASQSSHGGRNSRASHAQSRTTARSTGVFSDGAGALPSGVAAPSDVMLEPHAIPRAELRALPELVAHLEERIRQLEDMLHAGGAAPHLAKGASTPGKKKE